MTNATRATEATDAAVVERVLAGDADAFATLVDRYYDRYLRYAVHLVGTREDAEEALQDAFLRAYGALGRYEERERFSAWLLRIVVNQCRTVAASRRRRDEVLVELDAAALDPAAGEAREQAELRERLERALARLPAEQREAVVLRYADDLSYEELSLVTGAGVSALKMRVKRAFARLRELLQEAYCV